MLTRMVFTVAAILFALPTLAQAARPAREVVGTLTGNNVFVRSNPSTTGAYQCTKLSTGDKVVVLKAQGEWLQIKPVKGTWSVIAEKYVKPDAAGKVGTVQGDNVWVRAAGDLCTFANVADYYVWQGQLNKGDTVTILGKAGDYYKIAPPEFATFWIAAKYVDLGGKTAPVEKAAPGGSKVDAGPGIAAKTPVREPAQTKPPVGTVRTETTIETTTVRRPASQPALDPQSTLGQVETVRQEMMAEYKKPVEQRDLRRIIAKFNAIDTADNAQAAKLVEYYTKYMENQLEIFDDAKAATDQIGKKIVVITEIQTTIDNDVIEEQTNPRPKAYNAQGVIQASAVFPGTKYAPKRWVVRDPFTDRITAYVQCTSGDVDMAAHVGKHVGVWGAEIYDENLKLYIVDAQAVTVLGDGPARVPATPVQVQPAQPAAATTDVTEDAPADEDAAVEDNPAENDPAEDDATDEDDQEVVGIAIPADESTVDSATVSPPAKS